MTIHVLSHRDQLPEGVKVFDTTSRSPTYTKGVSPFFVGPVMANGLQAWNVENAWQYSKVYPEHVDERGNPTTAYFEWRNAGYNSKRAERYPMGKGVVPLYSLWNGERLSYVEARKKIYIPLYAEAVQKTDAFAQLKAECEALDEVVLLDFDAYDHRALHMTWEQVINSPDKKMGHAFVLAMLIEGVKLS